METSHNNVRREGEGERERGRERESKESDYHCTIQGGLPLEQEGDVEALTVASEEEIISNNISTVINIQNN